VNGTCPNCGAETHFTYVGDQELPKEAQEALGVEKLVLYDCDSCGSTRSERSIKEASQVVLPDRSH
jgi:predicted RNA-binding Zn-ribbon protein involved in translation (DUF1610 family)